jgi:hypothetical protein
VPKALLNLGERGIEAARYVSDRSSQDPSNHYVDCIDGKTIREKAAPKCGSLRLDYSQSIIAPSTNRDISIELTRSTLAPRG